jgi:hypothetical protein
MSYQAPNIYIYTQRQQVHAPADEVSRYTFLTKYNEVQVKSCTIVCGLVKQDSWFCQTQFIQLIRFYMHITKFSTELKTLPQNIKAPFRSMALFPACDSIRVYVAVHKETSEF